MNKRSLLLSAGSAALGALLPAASAFAADGDMWPTRPVHMLVGFPAGSSPDVTARILAESLSSSLGQPVIVENKPGASGNIATEMIARAKDDHTIGLVINGNLTSSPVLYPKLWYHPEKDFTYLSLLTTAPLVLVTQPSEPAGAAFFDAARAAGARWNYGSVGVGSVGQLAMEVLKTRVPGLLAEHVPFQGNPQVVTALIGGQIQMALVPPGLAMPQVKAGKLRAIGITSGRSALVPDVPPLADAGVRNFTFEVWNALLGPASLSKGAQDRINREIAVIMKKPEVRQRLFDQGWQAVGSSPEGMRTKVKEESDIIHRVIATKGIRLE